MNASEILESVRALTRGETPTTDIAKVLYRHKCFYLLSKIKNNPYTKQLFLEQTLNRIALRERYRICSEFFEKADFPYAVIKGAVLSDAAYKDPLARISGDIDLLIRREDADKVKSLLTSCGFIQGRITSEGIVPFSRREILFQSTMSHQTAPYIKQTGNKLCPYINVDVNTDIIWGESEKKCDMNIVLSQIQKSSLFGTSFCKLSPEMEFIALCLHHYKDLNSLYLLSNGSMRLSLYCDMYFYLQNSRPDAKKIKDLCVSLSVGCYVYECISQVQRIFESQFLNEYLDALKSEKDPSLADSFGLNARERKKWQISLEERLFHENLPKYIWDLLDDSEKEKVQINRTMM